MRRWVGRQTTAAQIVNLLYRRLGVGGRWNSRNRVLPRLLRLVGATQPRSEPFVEIVADDNASTRY